MSYLGAQPAPKATELDDNSVTTADIQNNAVTSAKLDTNIAIAGNTTLGDASGDSVTINAATTTFAQGTANGVTYLNGSKVLTSGSALTFNGSILVNTAGGIAVQGGGAPASGYGWEIYNNGATENYLQSYNRTGGSYMDSIYNAATHQFKITGAEQMRLTSTGLGIGTSSPQTRLQITTASDGSQAIFSGNQSTNEQTLLFRNAYYTNNGTAGVAAIGWIDSGSSGGNLTFKTGTNGGGTTNIPTERMRIDSSGNVVLNNAAWLQFKDSGGTARNVLTIDAFNGLNINSAGSGSAAPIVFKENGTEIARFDTSGNLGIGTSSPSANLDVVGSNSRTRWSMSATTCVQTTTNTAANAYAAQRYDADSYQFYTTGSEKVRIDSSGNVLVGTTGNPAAAKLFVAGGVLAVGTAATPEFQIAYDGTNGYLDARLTGGGLIFRTNGSTERMRITSGGDVGIGTTPSGSAKLHLYSNSAYVIQRIQNQTSAMQFQMNDGVASGAGVIYMEGSGPLTFWTGGSQNAQLDSSGNFKFNSGYGSTATVYGCRAWVNFDGAGTGFRASGNVSSITDHGVGNYTINFSTAMPDSNYSTVASFANSGAYGQVAATLAISGPNANSNNYSTANYTTAGFRVVVTSSDSVPRDNNICNFAVFR